MSVLALLAFFLCAILDWTAVGQGQKRLEYVAKPAALAALLIYATTGANPSGWLIAALVLSLLGDVYLMLPAELFVAGLTAFLLAHVAYIIDFDVSVTARLGGLVVVAMVLAPVAARIISSVREPALRGAVGLYIAVIALMVASALGSGSPVAALGAVLFCVSDAIIAWNRFVQPLPWSQPVIMITYHLGQLGLVTALRAG